MKFNDMRKFVLTIIICITQFAEAQVVSRTVVDSIVNIENSLFTMYESSEERIASLQISNAVLKNLNTSDLLEICLNNPYLIEMSFFANYQDGLSYMAYRFDSFKELISRNDLGNVLIERERNFSDNVLKLSTFDLVKRGNLSFQNRFIDTLIALDVVRKNLAPNQGEELDSLQLARYNTNHLYSSVFGSSLKKSQYIPSYSSISIYTPKGTQVPNAKKLSSSDCNYTNEEMAALESHLHNAYNGAEMIEPWTFCYDTNGWTWHTSETDEKVCIPYMSDNIYITDSSYIAVPEPLATKVVYGNYNYFSAVRESLTWYVSKWGPRGPLVRHHLTNIPDGTDSFFSNR